MNPGGECLMEYLVSMNRNILNKGYEATFVISNRKAVINLTLGTDNIGDVVTNWHVSDESASSDHRYTVLQVGDDLLVPRLAYSNPKRTNWESCRKVLEVNLGIVPRVTHLTQDLELVVDMLHQAILLFCHENCPARVVVSQRMVTWWNKGLSILNASTRQLLKHANRTGDWESYKKALTYYNKEIRKAK